MYRTGTHGGGPDAARRLIGHERLLRTLLPQLRTAHFCERPGLPLDVVAVLRFVGEHVFDPSLNVATVKLGCELRNNNISMRFHRALGVTIREHIERARMKAACYLLARTSVDIYTIAVSVGYEHHETFVRAFQRQFRCTPSDYRAVASMVSDASDGEAEPPCAAAGPCIAPSPRSASTARRDVKTEPQGAPHRAT